MEKGTSLMRPKVSENVYIMQKKPVESFSNVEKLQKKTFKMRKNVIFAHLSM